MLFSSHLETEGAERIPGSHDAVQASELGTSSPASAVVQTPAGVQEDGSLSDVGSASRSKQCQ